MRASRPLEFGQEMLDVTKKEYRSCGESTQHIEAYSTHAFVYPPSAIW